MSEQIESFLVCTYFSLFSSSLSSCRLRGLPTVPDPSSTSTANGGVEGLLNGVEVKQVFGLDCGRSALTGVGFILLDGLDALKENKCYTDLKINHGLSGNFCLTEFCVLTRVKWVMTQQEGSPPSC